ASCLPGVSVASGAANDAAAPSNGARDQRTIKTHSQPIPKGRPSFATQSPRKRTNLISFLIERQKRQARWRSSRRSARTLRPVFYEKFCNARSQPACPTLRSKDVPKEAGQGEHNDANPISPIPAILTHGEPPANRGVLMAGQSKHAPGGRV